MYIHICCEVRFWTVLGFCRLLSATFLKWPLLAIVKSGFPKTSVWKKNKENDVFQLQNTIKIGF